MPEQKSEADNLENPSTNGQRNQNSLRVKMYTPKSYITPEMIHGLGDYKCPLQKTLMPVGKKTTLRYSKDTPKE
jgi:hypothetical protein